MSANVFVKQEKDAPAYFPKRARTLNVLFPCHTCAASRRSWKTCMGQRRPHPYPIIRRIPLNQLDSTHTGCVVQADGGPEICWDANTRCLVPCDQCWTLGQCLMHKHVFDDYLIPFADHSDQPGVTPAKRRCKIAGNVLAPGQSSVSPRRRTSRYPLRTGGWATACLGMLGPTPSSLSRPLLASPPSPPRRFSRTSSVRVSRRACSTQRVTRESREAAAGGVGDAAASSEKECETTTCAPAVVGGVGDEDRYEDDEGGDIEDDDDDSGDCDGDGDGDGVQGEYLDSPRRRKGAIARRLAGAEAAACGAGGERQDDQAGGGDGDAEEEEEEDGEEEVVVEYEERGDVPRGVNVIKVEEDEPSCIAGPVVTEGARESEEIACLREEVEMTEYAIQHTKTNITDLKRVTEEALSRIESSRRTLEAAEAKMSVEEQYLEELEEQIAAARSELMAKLNKVTSSENQEAPGVNQSKNLTEQEQGKSELEVPSRDPAVEVV